MESSVCSIEGYLLTDNIQEEREAVVIRIRELLPIDLPPSSGDRVGLEETFVQLAEVFDRPTTPERYAKFTAAMDEIQTSYANECSGTVSVPSKHEITELANAFKELTRRLNYISAANLTKARAIYGRFLCYTEREASVRTKRQSTECECPSDREVTLSCHFFACLEAEEMKTIVGFGNDPDSFACIGFAVDTTGSMSGEIAAARRVILEFIKTQANSTLCYMLVPFNDHGIGHPMST
jgi:hypothetical protein